MAICAHPTCHSNDDLSDDQMFMEYMDIDDVWVPVCGNHVDRDKPHVEVNDETSQMTGDELMAHAED